MLTLCNGILPLTQGLGQATCCKLADYGCKSKNCLCVSCSFWTTIDIWKEPMKWIEYFQQAVLLCLLRALCYAGICSYAACIILCPKLCWHNSPRPTILWRSWNCLPQTFLRKACTVPVTVHTLPHSNKSNGIQKLWILSREFHMHAARSYIAPPFPSHG